MPEIMLYASDTVIGLAKYKGVQKNNPLKFLYRNGYTYVNKTKMCVKIIMKYKKYSQIFCQMSKFNWLHTATKLACSCKVN